MELSVNLVCPCNGRAYGCEKLLKAHHKTKIHKNWESQQLQKDIHIKINRLEIENDQLKRINAILVERIELLTGETKKLKVN